MAAVSRNGDVPLPAQVPERTVPALLRRNVEFRPDRIALIASSAYGGEEQISYEALSERAGKVARVLADRGIRAGDRVGVLLGGSAALEAHVVYHAAHRIGAVNVPLNDRYVPRELDLVMRSSGLRALVFGSASVPTLRRLSTPLGGVVLLEAGETPVLGDDLRAAYTDVAEADQVEVSEHDDADWIFTSGTTGKPKAVALTHGNSVACGYQAQCLWGLDSASVYQSSAPFFTSTGCHTNLLGSLAAGCTYAVEPEFDVRATLERVGRYRSTSVFIVSGMLQLMLQRVSADEWDRFDLRSLQRLCYGGQSMPSSFYRSVQELFDGRHCVELLHLYGLTEAGTGGLLLPPEQHAEAVVRAGRYGLSIGTRGFNDWIDFRVVNGTGDAVEPGEVGELELRGPSVMDRYVDEPEATASAVVGGWLRTGDMATVDEEDFVYFVDRRRQMIRRGGLNMSSTEIEGVLGQHPAVAEVAVVGRPNPILGQEPVAFVVLAADRSASEAELNESCSRELADYKVPVAYHIVDRLPRNAMGRVVKGELAEQ